MILAQKVWKWQAWANQTSAHPVALSLTALLGMIVLMAPRRFAIVAFFALGCFVSQSQRIVIAGLDFDFIRILVIVGITRIAIRGEFQSLKIRRQDVLLVLFVLTSTIAMMIRIGSSGLTNRLGFALNALGLYFCFRCWVKSKDDFVFVMMFLALLLIPVSTFFFIEKVTGRNPFAFLGGVPEFTAIRNGRLRCQGAFSHAILAGVFFASLVPVYGGMYLGQVCARWKCILGGALSLLVVFFTSSSTPISAVIIGAIGWLAFPLRREFRIIRWGILIGAICLHFVMKKGVWHLLARIDFVGGSTGWHRYYLIDRAVANLDEWWAFGVASTDHWGHGLYDVTNQYIVEGTRGGLLAVVFLFLIIITAFSNIGKTIKRQKSRQDQFLLYGIGVLLLVHMCVFISVSYFGQIIMWWYFTLASIESLSEESESEQLPASSIARHRPRSRRTERRPTPGMELT